MIQGDSSNGGIREPLLDGNDSDRLRVQGAPTVGAHATAPTFQRRDTISAKSILKRVNILPERDDLNRGFSGNAIQTSKYTTFSFIPKNLIEQFTKMANVYFLFITFMQMIPVISISGGKPAMLVPLTFVILVSMIKDLFEDLKRHKSDKAENYMQVLVYNQRSKEFEPQIWRNVKVGEIVKVQNDEYFPSDILLLGSSENKGVCYVETKNLDGETNLKHKMTEKQILNIFTQQNSIEDLKSTLECEEPNDQIYKFEGTLTTQSNQKIPVGVENFLLRGSSLRNTDWIIGAVIYAGHQTKIMKNSVNARYKRSKIETETNRLIIIVFLIQLACCTVGAFYGATWMTINVKNTTYMQFKQDDEWNTNWFLLFIKTCGTWILIFTNFVPISLLVTLELVKFWQAMFMSYEWRMYDLQKDMPAAVQASNLNEELGQVEYVFSDKTGTLTCNIMEFKKFSAGPVAYGVSTPKDGSSKIENVNFEDDKLWEHLKDSKSANHANVKDLLLHLSLCHSIIVDERKGKYNASSPDELALVNAAKYFGAVFLKRDEDNNMIVNFLGQELRYKLLNILEFNSTRKRMSVIVQDPQGKIMLLCKGADSVIMERLDRQKSKSVDETLKHIEAFAVEGLRTLLLAKRAISDEEYDSWNDKFVAASQKVINREEELAKINELIEVNLELVGSTAIEDKLQDGVNETIQFMKNAGIKVWVLTGDKIETAINIGYSSGLLDNSMLQFLVTGSDTSQVFQELADAFRDLSQTSNLVEKSAIIVGGESLLRIDSNPKLRENFLQVVEMATVVLACRVSPKQKADIVNMVRQKYPNKTTLSIGDGANDVNMITAAHVGIGISGLEGQQAARSADFVIGQFQFLKPLIFIHGREAYRRNAFTVCYIFYKNVLFVLPQYWFGFLSVFSGQTLYEPWIYQLYNIVFTALPIMYFALFDFNYSKEKFLLKPKYYSIGINHECFGMNIFWRWIFYGAWQAFIVLFICFVAFESTTSNSGDNSELWMSGAIVYAAVVIIANIKLLDSFSIYTVWGELLIFMSIACYFIFFYLENVMQSVPQLFGTFEGVMKHPVAYVSLFFCGASIYTIDIMIENTKKYFRRKMKVQKIIDLEAEKAIFSHRSTAVSRKPTYTGFAFAEEAGNVPQITKMLTMSARRGSKSTTVVGQIKPTLN